jgi:prepilin-type N-terminal cleavage/methylation domain-containing protein
MKKNDEGFTLIELLIVIVILGILATIVVFAVRGVTSDSQKNSCKASQKTFQTAIEAWYAQGSQPVGTHPTGADLVTAGLIRSYDPAGDVIVFQGSGSGVTATSTVGANPSSAKCTNAISTS